MSIFFELKERNGGFFNQLWYLLESYLVSQKYGVNFIINDKNWMFSNKNGWIDYFEPTITINNTTTYSISIYEEDPILNTFTLQEYRNACSSILKLNTPLLKLLENTLQQFNLIKGNYDAIMIRRGDKMYGESKYINTEKYVNELLNKDTNIIFVQTDDYTAYKEVCNIINKNNKNIKVITTCPETKLGAFQFNYCPEIGSNLTDENDNYLKKLSLLPKLKTVCDYSPIEMKEHVEEMLIGMYICLTSRYLVTDFQSNATRFLKINHSNPENVISVDDTPYQKFNFPVRSPVFGFF